MKLELYQDILKTIKEFNGPQKDCVKTLIKKYNNVNKYTLHSILGFEVQQRMKCQHAKIFGTKNYYNRYLKAQNAGEPVGILLRISEKIKAPPALLARHILEKHFAGKVSRPAIGKLMKDTTLIEEKRLAYEIYLCVVFDNQYGPITDSIALTVGEEYEVKLKWCLKKRNIPFRDEEQLRLKGYDKTPDVKLEVPIAVGGHIINWIESKARFANNEVHKKYTKEQYLSYWNRFGPGLVIYWFGFLDNLGHSIDNKFIILDRFPEDITYINPASISALPFEKVKSYLHN